MKDWIMTYYKSPQCRVVEGEMLTDFFWLDWSGAIYLELGFKSQGWRSEGFLLSAQHYPGVPLAPLRSRPFSAAGGVRKEKKGLSVPVACTTLLDCPLR